VSSVTFGTRFWPTEIAYSKAEKILTVSFDNGESFRIPAELLRVESPSAEVQGHSPDQKQVVAGKQGVGIIDIEEVGNYAVKIAFDDLHDSGIYTWELLYDMGKNQDKMWADYLSDLQGAGLSRDPASVPAPKPKAGGCGGGGKSGGSCGCGG
jgi:DUF971 family protein